MPRLNERTHRLLCRAGFVVLCALPTLAVCAWIVAARLPSQRAAWENGLSTRLDAHVTLQSVSYPQPGVTRLEGLSILRHRAQEPWVQVKRLELRYDLGTWYADTQLVTLRDDGQGFGQFLVRCTESRHGQSTDGVQLLVDRVMLQGKQDDNSLRQLVVQRERGMTANLSLSLSVGEDASSPLRIELKPQADGALHARVETGPSELPAAVAALLLPEAARLGEKAVLRGTLDCTLADTGISGQLTGHMDRVDLTSLTARHLPPELAMAGVATLSLTDVRFQNGRLVFARGSLHSTAGSIGPRLIETVANELKLVGKVPAGNELSKSVDYDELAFDFSLDPRQFQVVGRCTGTPPGTMMTHREDGVVLLSTSNCDPQSPIALARMVSPLSREWIPATSQAQWLHEHLPKYR